MKKPDTMKQIVSVAVVALVLFAVIPLLKNSFKTTPEREVRVGETFTVTLESSADPDFRWELLATDAAKVELVHQPEGEEVLRTTEVWTFRAISAGEANLYFGYTRISSPTNIAARTHAEPIRIVPTGT